MYKRTKGFKRRRHIKKPIVRCMRNDKAIQRPNRLIRFAKRVVPYILLSVIVSLVVCATSCACFFAYIASSLGIKEHPLPSHAVSRVYDISKDFPVIWIFLDMVNDVIDDRLWLNILSI